MNKKKLTTLIAMTLVVGSTLAGCRQFDKPELIEITPSQTAILLPLKGDTSEQAQLNSEEYLQKNLVSAKRVEINHEWVKEGRGFIIENGRYIPTHKLIILERKPITREWTNDTATGTTEKKEGIRAETKESIAFSSNINSTAQIDEANAVKFLYRYNSASLESIMDTEIKSRIATKFVEQCATYSLSELLINKAKIMETVRADVIPYFAERGITITALGISGDLTYSNADIQASIDNKFKAEKGLETQKTENDRIVSKAQADAKAIEIQSSTIDKQLKLKELENQASAISKWDGKLSQFQGSGISPIINMNPVKEQYNQNKPINVDKAKKIIYNINKGCDLPPKEEL